MHYSIRPNTEIFNTHKISDAIVNFFSLEDNDLYRPIFQLTSLCCLDENGKKIFFYNNKSSNYCIFFECKLEDAFYTLISDFFKKKIDISLSYKLLLITEQISDTNDYFFKILNLTDFPSGKKGYNYFKTMKSFSSLLREKILHKRLGLAEAYLFHNYFKRSYDELVLMMPDNLSFSELGSAVRYFTEYSKKEKIKIEQLITLVKNKFQNNKINKDEFLNFIYKLRFPEHDKLKNKLDNYIRKLGLPKMVTIKYDKTFEHEEYELGIKFNTLDSLSKKLELMKKITEKKLAQINNNDLFIFENLFKKE